MLKSITGVMSWPSAANTADKVDTSIQQQTQQGAGVTASAGLMDGVKQQAAKLDESTADGTEDRFLKLLVAQMRNQDPMNPMENAEVTSQLAQISTVRGIETLNRSMDNFTATNAQSAVLAAVNMIGKQVLAPGERFAMDDSATRDIRLGFDLKENAEAVTLDILDANGNLVHRHAMQNQEAGNHSLSWDGKDTNGNALPAGQYRLQVNAANDGTAVTATALVPVTVTDRKSVV